ncbi:MAG: hypothetical protein P4L53_07505 [Candidatus Obscuribacterales bacterium]|nr:hypothetical protein [Candidatus Obscuribacterales bacterium]
MKKVFDIKKICSVISMIACSLIVVGQPALAQGDEEENDGNRVRRFPSVNRAISTSASTSALKILFIGNSILYGGDVPGVFLGLIRAKDAQAPVKMSEVVGGNYTLKNHLENGNALKAIDSEGPWDYVVLQEQSSHLGNEVAKSIAETKPLAAHIVQNHSKLAVFDAWTKLIAPDYAIFSQCNEQLARSLGAERVPVLTALAQAHGIQGVKLFISDGHHLDADGIYLAACMLYAKILRKSPVGLPNKVYLDDRLICETDYNRAKQLQVIASNYLK